jgi:hypothetical protein
VTKSFNDLPVYLGGAAPEVKIVDNLKQFLHMRIVRSRKNLTDDHIDLSNQFSLVSTIRRLVFAAAI